MADGDLPNIRDTYDEHDRAVMKRINEFITAANRSFPRATVAEKLDSAWSANIKKREEDSTDPVGRDADYYFAARHEIAKDKSKFLQYGKAALGVAGWCVYSALKVGSEAVGHPEWMRTDPDKPNAPVGGFDWMNRGSADGFQDPGDSVANVLLHKPDTGVHYTVQSVRAANPAGPHPWK